MATSQHRGHKIYYDFSQESWRYVDTYKNVSFERNCKNCGNSPTKEGHDACLGRLENVQSACCGHTGEGQLPYAVLKDGTRVVFESKDEMHKYFKQTIF